MNYVDKNLIPGETVVYRGTFSHLPYWWLVLPVAAAIGAAVYKHWVPAAIAVGLAVAMWGWIRMRLGSTEFAVTTRRVVIEVGVLQRHTVEMMLGQIEGMTVGITGRIFNFAQHEVIGSGRNTLEPLRRWSRHFDSDGKYKPDWPGGSDEKLEAARGGYGDPQ